MSRRITLEELIENFKTNSIIDNSPNTKNIFVLISCEKIYDKIKKDEKIKITDKTIIQLYRTRSIENRKKQEILYKDKYLLYDLNGNSNPSFEQVFYKKYLLYDLNKNSNPSLNTYKNKYLKYKNKYLQLKNKL